MAKALFAAGCFWGGEASFRELQGVKEVVSGYTGGEAPDPTYKDVCTGLTGHAETVEVTYNPDQVSYEKLLETFWEIHDPTTLNRQGVDVGTQYRSAIFYFDDEQKNQAESSLMAQQSRTDKKIVTEISPAQDFYKAEEYHQNYLAKNR